MFNETVLALSLGARHEGLIDGPTNEGLVGLPGEGEYALIQLVVRNDLVEEARFQTYTCPVARASCEMLCRVIQGHGLQRSLSLSPDDLISLLRGLPEGKVHLPAVAVGALRLAISPLKD